MNINSGILPTFSTTWHLHDLEANEYSVCSDITITQERCVILQKLRKIKTKIKIRVIGMLVNKN